MKTTAGIILALNIVLAIVVYILEKNHTQKGNIISSQKNEMLQTVDSLKQTLAIHQAKSIAKQDSLNLIITVYEKEIQRKRKAVVLYITDTLPLLSDSAKQAYFDTRYH